MHNEVDSLEAQLGKLKTDCTSDRKAVQAPRVVHQMDGTQRESPYLNPEGAEPYQGVDSLFGQSVAYVSYKKEKPQHRLILWARLNGHNVKETAALVGYSPQTVSNVCGQPWFQEAFARISSELGKDHFQTFLEGEVMGALQRTVTLANSAESEAVRLAANKEVLDRYLGKATVKVEQKVSGSVDSMVYDVAKLLEENTKVAKELAARGIGGIHGNS